MIPTARNLAHFKALGYAAKVVERWNPFAKVRHDVFGADILALKAGEILAVKVTTGANHAAHHHSLLVCPRRHGADAPSTTSHDRSSDISSGLGGTGPALPS